MEPQVRIHSLFKPHLKKKKKKNLVATLKKQEGLSQLILNAIVYAAKTSLKTRNVGQIYIRKRAYVQSAIAESVAACLESGESRGVVRNALKKKKRKEKKSCDCTEAL